MTRTGKDHAAAAALAAIKAAAASAPARAEIRENVDRAWHVRHLVPPVRAALRLALRPRRVVLCHPAVPSQRQLLLRICVLRGDRITGDPSRRADVAVHTMKTRGRATIPDGLPVVNRDCTDVAKSTVARHFEAAFGYSLAVDPTRYEGAMVEKSEENTAHDGRVLHGPLRPDEVRPGKVYQRYVRAVAGDQAVDLRTPLIGGRVPLVIEKHRPEDMRFVNFQHRLRMHAPGDVYTPDELAAFGRFAEAIGLDFGELDVLRDVDDGRIYVVDVNNRPASPAKELAPADQRRCLARLADAFDEMVDALPRGA